MNHSYDTIKVILLVLIVILVGYFVFTNVANRNLDESGRVYSTTKNLTPVATNVKCKCPDGGTCNGDLMGNGDCVCWDSCKTAQATNQL